jgi:hypothetical protein
MLRTIHNNRRAYNVFYEVKKLNTVNKYDTYMQFILMKVWNLFVR